MNNEKLIAALEARVSEIKDRMIAAGNETAWHRWNAAHGEARRNLETVRQFTAEQLAEVPTEVPAPLPWQQETVWITGIEQSGSNYRIELVFALQRQDVWLCPPGYVLAPGVYKYARTLRDIGHHRHKEAAERVAWFLLQTLREATTHMAQVPEEHRRNAVATIDGRSNWNLIKPEAAPAAR